VQHELARARVDRVAGVGAALVAHDEVGALGEHVDHFALTLVAHWAPTTTTQCVFGPNTTPPIKKPLAGWTIL